MLLMSSLQILRLSSGPTGGQSVKELEGALLDPKRLGCLFVRLVVFLGQLMLHPGKRRSVSEKNVKSGLRAFRGLFIQPPT